jgi:hypothetical protein
MLWKKFFQKEQGATLVLMALFTAVSVGFAALAIDIGQLYYFKSLVKDRAEAVALAAVQEILKGESAAKEVGYAYAQKNKVVVTSIVADQSKKTVTVEAEDAITYVFAGIFGFTDAKVSGKAVAIMGSTVAGTGFLPLGVVKENFDYGKEYTLKYVAHESQQGNFGSLALGGSGGSNYEHNLKYGYDQPLKIDEMIYTETGNKQGPTRHGLEERITEDASRAHCKNIDTVDRSCSRLLYIPLIDTLDVSGKKQVKVLGFAVFYMSELENGPQLSIKGKFVRMPYPGEMSTDTAFDNGLYSPRLISFDN